MDAILKQKLKRLIEHSDWEVIYAFQAKMVETWNKQPIVGENEFQTLKNAISLEAKVEGLKEFFDSAERLALDTE